MVVGVGAFVPSVTSQREKHGCGKGKRVKDGLFALKLEDTNPLMLQRRRKKKHEQGELMQCFSPFNILFLAAKDKKILCKQQERRGGELS